MDSQLSLSDPKKVWLNRFLKVYNGANRDLYKILVEASEDAEKMILEIAGKSGIGATVERKQLTAIRSVIAEVLKELFRGKVSSTISEARMDAAESAVQAANVWDNRILRLVTEDLNQAKVLKKSLEQTARRNIENTVMREINGTMPLSKQVYRTEALAKDLINRRIASGVASGSSADKIARTVKDLIKPSVSGGVSYAANRLARTEINNAFHAQSVQSMKDRPWVSQAKWNLSKSHKPSGCMCERYAKVGEYPVNAVPNKPHPQCFCFITSVVPDTEFIIQQFESGMYDQWLSSNGQSGAA